MSRLSPSHSQKRITWHLYFFCFFFQHRPRLFPFTVIFGKPCAESVEVQKGTLSYGKSKGLRSFHFSMEKTLA
jgi:hypothetical protein